MTRNLPTSLIPDPNQRIGHEMRGPCCTLVTIGAHSSDMSGQIRQCRACGSTYINDHGLWRNTLSFDKKKLQKLSARRAVDELLSSRTRRA